jgi:hypothetical protein
MSDLSRVLLVGGSSRMPLVADVVRSATGLPVAVDAHPKHAIALGAATAGAPAEAAAIAAAIATPAASAVETPPAPRPDPLAPLITPAPAAATGRRSPLLLVGAAIAVVVVAAAALLLLGGGDDGDDGGAGVAAASTTVATVPAAYPPGSTDRFRGFCEDQGVPGPVCRCAVQRIQEGRTYPEFVELEKSVYADPEATLPADVTDVFKACTASSD